MLPWELQNSCYKRIHLWRRLILESILTSFLNILINIGYYVKRIILAFIINILGIIMFFGTVDLPLDIKTALHYAMRNFWTYFLTYFLVMTDEDISSPSSSAFKKNREDRALCSRQCCSCNDQIRKEKQVKSLNKKTLVYKNKGTLHKSGRVPLFVLSEFFRVWFTL